METKTRQKDALLSADTPSGGKAHSNTVHDLCKAQITGIFVYGSVLQSYKQQKKEKPHKTKNKAAKKMSILLHTFLLYLLEIYPLCLCTGTQS